VLGALGLDERGYLAALLERQVEVVADIELHDLALRHFHLCRRDKLQVFALQRRGHVAISRGSTLPVFLLVVRASIKSQKQLLLHDRYTFQSSFRSRSGSRHLIRRADQRLQSLLPTLLVLRLRLFIELFQFECLLLSDVLVFKIGSVLSSELFALIHDREQSCHRQTHFLHIVETKVLASELLGHQEIGLELVFLLKQHIPELV